MIIKMVLGIALIISLITDIQKRKILNIVTLPSILFGLIYYTSMDGWNGLLFSGKGLLIGFGFLLIPYLLGGMGAGDVKLMAAIGALTGVTFTFYAFIYTAIIGGIISFFLILRRKGGWDLIKSLFYIIPFIKGNLGSFIINEDKESSISFPYGVAIVLGTICASVIGGI